MVLVAIEKPLYTYFLALCIAAVASIVYYMSSAMSHRILASERATQTETLSQATTFDANNIYLGRKNAFRYLHYLFIKQ